MNPYLTPRPPIDPTALAAFNNGTRRARNAYLSDADTQVRRRVARAESQRKYREKKRGAK